MFVQTEITPNPNSLKFIPGKVVSSAGSFEVNKNDIQSMGEVVKLSIKETTEQLNLHCPLDAEFKTGSSWADTH